MIFCFQTMNRGKHMMNLVHGLICACPYLETYLTFIIVMQGLSLGALPSVTKWVATWERTFFRPPNSGTHSPLPFCCCYLSVDECFFFFLLFSIPPMILPPLEKQRIQNIREGRRNLKKSQREQKASGKSDCLAPGEPM